MLDYIALGLLFFVAITLFYGIIAIHDIPYEIAKERNHPHQDAIHVSGWVSLFTLHVIWPFLWIWATLYREEKGWGFINEDELTKKIQSLEKKIQTISDGLPKTKEIKESSSCKVTEEPAPSTTDLESPPEDKL